MRNVFFQGFAKLRSKLDRRAYASVLAFARDLGLVFRRVSGLNDIDDVFDAHMRLINSLPREENISDEQKEEKKLAKRIVKAVQQLLRDALLKEAELGGEQYEQSLARMKKASDKEAARIWLASLSQICAADSFERVHDILAGPNAVHQLEFQTNGIIERHDRAVEPDEQLAIDKQVPLTNGLDENGEPHIASTATVQIHPVAQKPTEGLRESVGKTMPSIHVEKDGSVLSLDRISSDNNVETGLLDRAVEQDALLFLYHGGTPWYVEQFDPRGTTVQEERWTGPEILRGMSEELSEMDDEELQGLGPQPGDIETSEEPPNSLLRSMPARATRRNRG